jgi:murein L,D-transpeptidase YcbB/YkuD
MGLQLSPVDPDSIVWSGLSVDDFEYSFTQAPGEGNPLGRIKFIFPNPYNVYLHDTPHTQLFAERDRAFSHGCIRLEKSAELAEHILRGQGHWPLARVERELASGINRGVVLVRPLPVYLLYWTTWVDEEGLLQFRRDEYDADYLLRQALRHR